jgi:ribosome-binding factor A
MSPTNHRHERIGEEIAHEINAMLAGELKDPRLEGMVVVTEVRVQPDMKHARVFINARGKSKPMQSRRWSMPRATFAAKSSSVCRCAACRNCTLRWTFPKSASLASSNS